MRYLLDTNALSETARPRPSEPLLRRLQAHRAEVCTSSVVWHELRFGVARLPPGARRDTLVRWLAALASSSLLVLPYDVEAARWHAEERARLEREGRVIPFRDAQIAAVARVNGLTLVTANVADFAGLEGLVVENWLEAERAPQSRA